MSYRVCFIVPYFGKFPNTFQVWLNCCKNNQDFNWLILTDDDYEYKYPQNVEVVYTTLEKLKRQFEKILSFDIELQYAYKLCDFKPLYGDLFSEYIKDFSHWGYCDVDLFFGRLNRFFTTDRLKFYDKISVLGHMSVFKNDKELNVFYKKCNYKAILQDKRVRVFDEVRFEPNINSILKSANRNVLDVVEHIDIGDEHFYFINYEYSGGKRLHPCTDGPIIVQYENGVLYKVNIYNKELVKNEVAYVHFQKREIEIEVDVDVENFLVIPNKIIPNQDILSNYVLYCENDDYKYFIVHRCNRIIRAIKSRIKR